MPQHDTASIFPLERADGLGAGGKATGLARLARLGLNVPAGFVVMHAGRSPEPSELARAYAAIGGGPVAVRSSAAAEDGADASFAGQFDTFLGVEGDDELRSAVDRCVGSLTSDRAAAYSRNQATDGGGDMSVVVQRMVDARAAGVLFTVDPVRAASDRIVVDAVAGLGEALVNGHASPDQFVLDRNGGGVRDRALSGAEPVLTDGELVALAKEALRAEAEWGAPLDLEWAVDHAGTVFWLQARPITTVELELDGNPVRRHDTDVYTRANIGEMMPGPVTQLTSSTTFWAVEEGLQRMQRAFGGLTEHHPGFYMTALLHGHLFFNLTAMAECGRNVAGQNADTIALAIAGRHVPELVVGPRARWMTQARQYRALDFARPFLADTVHMHLHSSAGSGALIGVIQGILSKGQPPTTEEESALVAMLAGATGVESAALVDDLDRVASSVEGATKAETFCDMTPDDALVWLERVPGASQAFGRFLDKHGHRSFREAEMRQPSWRDDPRPLVSSLQASVAARRAGATRKARPQPNRPGSAEAKLRGRVPERLLRYARTTVANRERSKSMMVKVIAEMRRGYRRLGRLLVEAGQLPDEDLLFFLTHDEVGRLVRDGEGGLHRIASRRRRTLEQPDVGWTPYFAIIGGLATDVGSPISHGAVVAREYGLPAVVNLRSATRTINTGDLVELDGTRGPLRRL